jgi:ribose 5-phosphate isomerase A
MFHEIADPASLEVQIKHIPGALESGLFVGLARAAVVAGKKGTVFIEASPQ